MKYLLLFIIFFNLYAIDIKNFNKFKSCYGNENRTTDNKTFNNDGYLIEFDTYTDITFNDYISINNTLNFTKHSNIQSKTFGETLKSQHFFEISELIFNVYLTPSNIFSIGIFSFKNGAFSEHSGSGIRMSDALTTIYYLNMTGTFFTHHIDENNKIQIGYGKRIDDIYKLPEDRYDDTRNGSDISYLFITNKFKKHNIIFNASTSNIIYEKISNNKELRNFGKMLVTGVGYQYDDLDTSGIIYYGILAGSVSDFDGTVLTPDDKEFINNNYKFSDEGQQFGYSSLFGIKKEIDSGIFNLDSFIGIEYFYSSPYWISYSVDSLNIDGYGWGNNGNIYKFYAGVNITPKIKLGFVGRYEDLNSVKIPGGNSVKESDDKIFRQYLKLDIVF